MDCFDVGLLRRRRRAQPSPMKTSSFRIFSYLMDKVNYLTDIISHSRWEQCGNAPPVAVVLFLIQIKQSHLRTDLTTVIQIRLG